MNSSHRHLIKQGTSQTDTRNLIRDRILKVFQARLNSPDGGGAILINHDLSRTSSCCLDSRNNISKIKPQNVTCISGSKRTILDNTSVTSQTTSSSRDNIHMKHVQKSNKKRKNCVLESSESSDGKDDITAMSDQSTQHNMDSPENNRMRKKKRKTRGQRNKTKSAATVKKVDYQDRSSNVGKHLATSQKLSNTGPRDRLDDNDLSFARITNTRLTKRLGLFNLGKKSSKIEREPIVVSDSIRKKTDADLWKIIHDDKEDNCQNKMDIDSPRREILPLPTLKSTSTKRFSSVKLIIPPRPDYTTPNSKSNHDSATLIPFRSNSNGSIITTGSSAQDLPNSPPLEEISNYLMKPLRKQNTGNDLLQETCDDLKKLMKQNAPLSATPMTGKISTRSTSSNNGSIHRSLLESFLREKQDDSHSSGTDIPFIKSFNSNSIERNQSHCIAELVSQENVELEETDVPMLSNTQSPFHNKVLTDAKSLLQCNDMMVFNKQAKDSNLLFVNSGNMMEIGPFSQDASGAMSTSQSSGINSIHNDRTSSIEQLLYQDRSVSNLHEQRHNQLLCKDRYLINLHEHRENLRTAIERASRPIRSTEAVITELQPCFMPEFHANFYKDTLDLAESVWPESHRNTYVQSDGLDILELLDTGGRCQKRPSVSYRQSYIPDIKLDELPPNIPSWHFPSLPPSTSPSSPPKLFPRRLY